MEDKKGTGMCRESGHGCACGGSYGDHWMSRSEYSIARGLMTFVLVLFVFWIGLTLGEFKAYVRMEGFGYTGMMPSMMRWDQGSYAPLTGRTASSEAIQSPAPTKK